MPWLVKASKIDLIDSALEIKSTEMDAMISITEHQKMQAFIDMEEVRERTNKVALIRELRMVVEYQEFSKGAPEAVGVFVADKDVDVDWNLILTLIVGFIAVVACLIAYAASILIPGTIEEVIIYVVCVIIMAICSFIGSMLNPWEWDGYYIARSRFCNLIPLTNIMILFQKKFPQLERMLKLPALQ